MDVVVNQFFENQFIFLYPAIDHHMETNSIILKLEHSNIPQTSREGVKINKIVSSISPSTLIRLVRVADNRINPRTATANAITKAIYETLDKSPELFWYKTKGILIATENCELLERNRIRVSFDKPLYEGIMDGGHNTFAVARFIVDKLFGVTFKKWDECKEYWDEHFDEIVDKFQEVENTPAFRFSIPVEIVFPGDDESAREEYYATISEICSARNNNIQLKETAKGNQIGCYDYLKDRLQSYPIIWKTGESGRIRAEDVIAMANIPLYYLQENGLLPDGIKRFNRVNLYASKGQCVSFFNEVISNEQVSAEEHGKYIVTSHLVKSALSMTEDIMKFFDILYLSFPEIYNANQGSFGRITAVKNGVPSKPLFGTINKSINYTYPDGYIYPLLGGIVGLMKYDEASDTLRWKINPISDDFILSELPLTKYVGWLKKELDPQKNGKNQLMYLEAEEAYDAYVNKHKSSCLF